MACGMAGLPADLVVCQSSMVRGRRPVVPVMPLSVTLVRGLLFQPLDHRQIKGQTQLSGSLSVFQIKSRGTYWSLCKKGLWQDKFGKFHVESNSLYRRAFLSLGYADVCCKSLAVDTYSGQHFLHWASLATCQAKLHSLEHTEAWCTR